jgi:hypothetical protein
MAFEVRTISPFEKYFKRLKRKYPSLAEDVLALSMALEEIPTQGTPIGKGCYKIRLAISSKGKGKSGGARVITYVKVIAEQVFLLTIYDKAEREDLEPNELTELLALLPEDESKTGE